MNDDEELAYEHGRNAAYLAVFKQCARYLPELKDTAAAAAERADAIALLRQVCSEHGDNDWPDDLHLGDIIDKHLWRHLMSTRSKDEAS